MGRSEPLYLIREFGRHADQATLLIEQSGNLEVCIAATPLAQLAADHLAPSPYAERLSVLRAGELAVHGTNPSQAREGKEKST
ncbi:MAG: hypothetical protein ABI671_14645 [Burkholderiales bacterium]